MKEAATIKPATVKVKQSLPKIAKFTESNDSLLQPKNRTHLKPTSSAIQSLPKPVQRVVAETELVDGGLHRRIKKLTIENVISSVSSPVAKVKPMVSKAISFSTPSSSSSSLVSTSLSTNNASKNRIRWSDGFNGTTCLTTNLKKLVRVRTIPPEGKGQKVGEGQSRENTTASIEVQKGIFSLSPVYLFKRAHTSPLFVCFCSFSNINTILKQINVKKFHLVPGAGIQTYNLSSHNHMVHSSPTYLSSNFSASNRVRFPVKQSGFMRYLVLLQKNRNKQKRPGLDHFLKMWRISACLRNMSIYIHT